MEINNLKESHEWLFFLRIISYILVADTNTDSVMYVYYGDEEPGDILSNDYDSLMVGESVHLKDYEISGLAE